LVAVTVNVDELPDVIEVGFAVIVTVGAEFVVTVTVAVAEVVPPAPVAAAVYVAVVAGLTVCVPPPACRLYVLPSVPVTVT
jgi:predicted tellurium resistance membrane protein TerC